MMFNDKKFLQNVEHAISTYGMLSFGDTVLVGVSGGPDSVVLLHSLIALINRYSLKLGIAHLNHSLRGDDAEKDALFVETIAEKLGIPFYLEKVDVRIYQKKQGLSLEEAARHVRYAFYYRTAEKYGFNKIALGHHLDDNAELILMYLFRGSGLRGISGIPPVRDGKVVRPLITTKRSDILKFIKAKGLTFISDQSNKDIRYLRNKIRHTLIPALRDNYNPRLVETLGRLGSIVRSEEEWLEGVIDPLFEKSVSRINGKLDLRYLQLDNIHIAAKRRIIRRAIKIVKGDLRRISLFHIDAVVDLMENGPASCCIDLPDRIRIERSGDILSFSKENKPLRSLGLNQHRWKVTPYEYSIDHPGPNPIKIFIKETEYHMLFSCMNRKSPADFKTLGEKIAFFDVDKLCFPLKIRNFRQGDRFTPLGLKGTQKVKNYFINNKIPRSQRAKCPILFNQENIIWIAGYRIAESAKVTASTNKILKVELILA